LYKADVNQMRFICLEKALVKLERSFQRDKEENFWSSHMKMELLGKKDNIVHFPEERGIIRHKQLSSNGAVTEI